METKFECIYTMTEQINDESLKYLMFRRWNAVFAYICGGLFFLWGVGLGAWAYTLTGSVPRQVWLMMFLALLLPLLQVLMYVMARRQRSAQWKELAGDKPVTVTVRVTDTGLEYLSSARTEPSVLRFEEFKRVVETKNLLGVISAGKIMYPMAKDGFTVGTAEDCRAFLRSKGIK